MYSGGESWTVTAGGVRRAEGLARWKSTTSNRCWKVATNDMGNLLALCRDCHLKAHREIKPVNPWDLAIAELET